MLCNFNLLEQSYSGLLQKPYRVRPHYPQAPHHLLMYISEPPFTQQKLKEEKPCLPCLADNVLNAGMLG